MRWPPFFTLDLVAADLLPPGWDDALHVLADGPDRFLIESGSANLAVPPWTFSIVPGDRMLDRCPWLLPLYAGPLLAFAARMFERPLFGEGRPGSAVTLNILQGVNATIDWHADSNPVSGLLFVGDGAAGDGGELEFRDDEGRTAQLVPVRGTFVCFDASYQHRVSPLLSDTMRLTVPMVFHGEGHTPRPAAGMEACR